MTKGEKRALLIVLIIVLVGGSAWLYVRARQQEAKEEWMENWRQGKKKEHLLVKFGELLLAEEYRKSDHDEKYYEEFLENPALPLMVDYINEFIPKYYPSIEYQELTIEAMREDGVKVDAELEELGVKVSGEGEKRREKIIESGGELDEEKEKYMKEDGENSYGVMERALSYGRRKYIMTQLGYPELAEAYGEENDTYREVFLVDENLEEFLEEFDKAIEAEYPDLKRDKITIEELAGLPGWVKDEEINPMKDDNWYAGAIKLVYYNEDEVPVREIAEEIHARMGD